MGNLLCTIGSTPSQNPSIALASPPQPLSLAQTPEIQKR
jgi:hypothetical protein